MPRTTRSGSEKRDRKKHVSVRLSAAEGEALTAKAQAAGLSIGAFVRAAALGQAGPRARRQPTIDAVLLAQAVAQLNRAGSNLNQIARTLNAVGLMQANDNAAALVEVRAAVAAIRAAVGRSGQGGQLA